MSENTATLQETNGLSKPQKKRLLRVLPEQAPLRRGGPFVEPLPGWAGEGAEQPRALRSLARIVDNGLCHRCGSCVGICPTKVLGLDATDYPRIDNLAACTDCDLCVKVCPGDEFDFQKTHREIFRRDGVLRSTHGHFLEASIAHSTDQDVREHSSSGGLVTGLLLHLLDSKQIDGAIVIQSDENHLWKGKPVVARTREEILASMKSKYAITPTNSVFSEIREIPGQYALVGLPCQIHGYVKAAELDERIRERVVLTIGLYCHAAIEHDAFEAIWDSLGERAAEATRFVSRVGKHPGSPHIQLRDGTLYPVYHGERSGYRPSSMEMINILYRLYTPERCLTCFDALADFADIAVGDPWMAPPEDDVDFLEGWSFALLRTERGQKAYRALEQSGKIVARNVTRKEAYRCNALMASEKRWRAFRIIETLRRQGKAIPSYGEIHSAFPKHKGIQFLRTEGNILSHVLCFLPRYRRRVLNFFLGSGGYRLLWLNNKRRRLKFWIRDLIAVWRRRIFGRS